MWRKGNSHTPLVGIQTGAATEKESMEECTPVFIAALHIIVKIWNQPKCQSTDEWIKKM